MHIWVDADACPHVIKDLLYRAADRRRIALTLVANQPLRTPASPYVHVLRVPAGFDEADQAIVRHVRAGDLVVTADVPLAAEVVAKGAYALNPRGQCYTPENGVVNLLVSLCSFYSVWHTRLMKTAIPANPYKNHRFPAEIISHAVWLYYRFCLSYRDVEELLFARGITVTCEAIRKWCRKFGQSYAIQLRRRRPQPGDKWHLDKVGLTMNRKRHYLWRAVDQAGNILDILVQRRRDRHAAKKFFRTLLKGLKYVPRVIVTDKLKSYDAAKRALLPGVEHRQHRYLDNRTENSHQPTRQRERRMQGFKPPGHAQRFLAAHGPIAQHFRPRRHQLSASEYRQEMSQRFDPWQEITNLPTAA